jgi:hypothetical protein
MRLPVRKRWRPRRTAAAPDGEGKAAPPNDGSGVGPSILCGRSPSPVTAADADPCCLGNWGATHASQARPRVGKRRSRGAEPRQACSPDLAAVRLPNGLRGPSRRLPVVAVVTGLLALGLAACSSSGAKPVASRSTLPPATTSTTSRAQLEQTVVSQWTAAERASVAAAKDPGGPEVELLVDYFVDPALSVLRAQYAAYARDGLTNTGDIDLGQPRVDSLTAAQAVVVTCATNHLQLLHKATGQPVAGKAGDPTPTPNGIRSTMVLTPSGVWKGSSSIVEDGSCTGV